MKDYYHILGVERNASEEEIKKAYRKLAHQHHPDKVGGDTAKFKEMNEAYQVLSNKEKRAQFDQYGQTFDGAGGMPGGGAGFGGMRWNVNAEDLGDLGDIFETFFGGQAAGNQRPTYRRGSDIEVHEEITLEEAFRGVERTLKFNTYGECKKCGGQGFEKSKGVSKCTVCRGKGEIREERQTFFGKFAQVKTCPECRGRGEVPNEKCSGCKGAGRVMELREAKVNIAAGVEDGQIIKIAGKGEAGEFASGSGDLYVVVRVKPHTYFQRHKTDLVTEKDIRITDALLEREIEMKDVDGMSYTVKIPAGFNLRQSFKVQGRGMPKFGIFGSPSRGDLYINLNTKLPKSISHKAKKLLEDLEKEI
ncbi:MAG: molecular chaperone DnaJ [Candidatus Paceibacterota bacterium]|jgi:molecular chaperone DnaJ